ncbi:MAG: hypothetical protein JSV97_11560 [candidate division WOR-3 bacterium]|nr:MAG: hypothetical protein JSV97_11560 [candidate division WOR-3 bacterium]
MSAIDSITKKVKGYAYHQQWVDFTAYFIFTIATLLISASIALFLLKSPLYGLIGLIPLLFYRPVSLIERARELEKKLNLKNEVVSSIQLSLIPRDNKEKYSRELISAFIDDAARRIEGIDVTKFINYRSLHKSVQFLLIVLVFVLIHPAVFPAHFWYSLNHEIEYRVEPGDGAYPMDQEINIALNLTGVYMPENVGLIISQEKGFVTEKIDVENSVATKKMRLVEPVTYRFTFLDHITDEFRLIPIAPIYIEELIFHLTFPRSTNLKEQIKTGKELIVPRGTRVHMYGRASTLLDSASFEYGDTITLPCEGDEFSGEYIVRESGIALLHLHALSSLKEQIRIYAIPDLAPLVDIFYPGYNITMPNDMRVTVGIRCSDDYGLDRATFYYTFDEEQKQMLQINRGALEDTLFFEWNLSDLGMLPGDEVYYFADVVDNAGNTTRSKTYYIYFPTMEEIYEEVSQKEENLLQDFHDLHSEHTDEIEEAMRIQQKIMKERKISWAEQEKLAELIRKEEKILEKIEEWQAELEKTLEQLSEGIILDQKSLERLQEIMKILQEIAPDELRDALEQVQLQLDQRPEVMQRSLQALKDAQEELAKALERTLELLERYRQEERLKELAQWAEELARSAEELEQVVKEDKDVDISSEVTELNEDIMRLADAMEELAESRGLEQEIKDALENMAQETTEISSAELGEKKEGLDRLAGELQQWYESVTKSRAAQVRKKLLEILNQLIDISKTEERFSQDTIGVDMAVQDQVITATKIVAESLYTQQRKSMYVTPHMSKNLARAIKHMEQAKNMRQQKHIGQQNSQEAMRLINVVCYEMFRNLEIITGGGSSTGMDKFMQGLSDITKGQMSFNQSMFNMLPLPMGGLSGEQMAQLRRLAGRQRALREALEALRADAGVGQYQELLDDVVQDMKETEEELYQYKVTRELIERQKKVLSRLLDSQRSIRKEDFTKERKSKPGEDILERLSPKPLTEQLGRDELRELIQQALRESYPKEYELYIREYFKTLLEER